MIGEGSEGRDGVEISLNVTHFEPFFYILTPFSFAPFVKNP